MPVCDSQPRVYWLACAAVVLGWLAIVVQVVIILFVFEFKTERNKAIITKHDWEER